MSEEEKPLTQLELDILNSKALQHFQKEIESLQKAIGNLETRMDNTTHEFNAIYSDLDLLKRKAGITKTYDGPDPPVMPPPTPR